MIIRDFLYETDQLGKPYGWGVAQYTTPEKGFGASFCSRVYQREPEESHARLLQHLCSILPQADERAIQKVLKRKNAAD